MTKEYYLSPSTAQLYYDQEMSIIKLAVIIYGKCEVRLLNVIIPETNQSMSTF